MGLNLVKLREFQVDIEERCRKEQRENLTKELIELVLDKDLKYSFQELKDRKIAKQSARVLSYWVKKEVIQPATRVKEGGWFYFDRTESIWIDVVTQLREFGLDLGKILNIRDTLFKEKVKDFKLIDFCLMHSIVREPYLMIVYSNGKAGFMTARQYGEIIATEALSPHIVFNFYFLAKSIFPNNNFEIAQKDVETVLTATEMKLLYYLRTGDYEEIQVKLSDGEIYLMEASRKIDPKDTISKIIKEANYQSIQIKVCNGHIVNIKSTLQQRL